MFSNILPSRITLKDSCTIRNIFNNYTKWKANYKKQIDNIKKTILETIQQLNSNNQTNLRTQVRGLQYVYEVTLNNIGHKPYRLFIKKEQDKFFIHNSIGSLE